MIETKTFSPNVFNSFAIQAYRLVFGRILPQSLFRDKIPAEADRKAVKGKFDLEIVSHCWGYANMLTYQLSSFVNYPPTKLNLTVTVFYAEEDTKTKATLYFFSQITTPNITWNFHPLTKGKLFRRGIGRNMAARSTEADWIWFTDCDVIFYENCLDSLADSLQGEKGLLYFPKEEKITEMLEDDDPLLSSDAQPQVIDIETENFSLYERGKSRDKARGPFQIVHGDVARAIGYCKKLSIFQTESDRWRKTYEDTAFRWLLGTDGEPKHIDGVFHIHHVTKGRYKENSQLSKVRSNIRLSQNSYMAYIQQKSVKSHIMLFDSGHFPVPVPKMFTGQYWKTQNAITGQATGRGTTYFFKHDKNEYVLRHYRRGGLIRKVLSDQYIYTGIEKSRAWREFRLLQQMKNMDLNCPTPIAAMLKKTGLYYQADIILKKISSAKDLHHILLANSLTADVWKKIGQTIAKFHHHQIYLHDLNIHNIMLDIENEVWLIDFDKSQIRQGSNWKNSNIARLKRSFEKEKRLHNTYWQLADWQILISAYNEAAMAN